MAGAVLELVAEDRKRGKVMWRDRDSAKGEGALRSSGPGEYSPRLFSSAPVQNVPFIAVTSFLCLRFVSPAIMAPKLFHLRERHADARTSRTLLLLAKVWLQAGMPSWVHCVPGWLQDVFVTRPLILSRGTALRSLQSFPTVTQSRG